MSARAQSNVHMIWYAVVLFVIFLGAVGCSSDSATEPDISESILEQSYSVGDQPSLTVENEVGTVLIRTGASGTIQIAATKWAENESDLARIAVTMTGVNDSVYIHTETPANLNNAGVSLGITVPSGTIPDIAAGVGNIDYQDRPGEISRFSAGVGNITLRLPPDINVAVSLTTGVGEVNISGFAISGTLMANSVIGTIGSGDEGTITGSVGVGNIILTAN